MAKRLTDQEMKELGLMNDSIIQSVIIKLDAEKPRELRFRQYLDSKREEGYNMKETILNMYDLLTGEFSPAAEPVIEQPVTGGFKTTEQKKEVSESDFDGI